MAQEPAENGVVLTEAQKQARRRRNIALALAITALCLMFYAITVFKMGSAMFNRTL